MSAVATLAGPSRSLFRLAKEYVAKPVRRTIFRSNRTHRRDRITIERMQEVEERLLAAAMEHHPNQPMVLDHLLDEVERAALLGEIPPRVMPAGDVARAQRMEDLLLEAIVRSHPNGDVAIDRLFGDVCGDAVIGDEGDDDHELDVASMRIDNDFDGMS